MKIHINAGHGGKDPGACGNGLREKDITLKVSLLLAEQLAKHGFEVSCTRVTDAYISPYEIAKRANQDKSDLFISIHTNAAKSMSASGVETLVYSLGSKTAVLGKAINNHLVKVTGFTDRGIKARPDLAVLNTTKMDAILIELGFVTSKSDSHMMKKDGFLSGCAEAICYEVCSWYGIWNMEEKNKMENKTVPQWQKDGLKRLVSAGVVTDESYTLEKLNVIQAGGDVIGKYT